MEKQMKKSLSRQMTAVFVGLLAFVLAAVFIVNAVFLGHYYTTHKESDLLNTYNALKEAQESDELTDENKQWKLSYELEKMNIDVCVMNVDRDAGTINEIFSNVKEKSLLYDQTLRIFFSKDTGNETVLKSTDQYVMRKMTDRQNGTDYLEMWGYLDDDSFVLMRSPLESIRESASLANQFLIYLGIIGMVVGGLLVWIFSRKITRPVMELARLSEDMANLNFDMKYTSGGNNEIGILGENFNKMSLQLEKTVSELKTANNQLQKDIEQKEKLEDMRNEFLGNVSHELKTPIALIQGYAEGLQEGISDDPESRAFYCDVIVDEAKKMNRMVRKLLTLNHLEFGQDALTEEPFDICEMLTTLLNSSALEMQKKEIKVIKQYPASCMVIGDEFKIEEVCTNYISNAMNHVNGDMRICVTLEEQEDTVKITVANTGDPIPEDSLDKVWIKFYKVDKARTREYGGSGIGLSIVKAIMDAHKQPFGVYNTAEGVAFWFCLKKAPKEETDVQENENDTGSME